MGLEAGIWLLRFEFRPDSWGLGRKDRILGLKIGLWSFRRGYETQEWDLGLQEGIWAFRLGFEAGEGRDGEEEINTSNQSFFCVS